MLPDGSSEHSILIFKVPAYHRSLTSAEAIRFVYLKTTTMSLPTNNKKGDNPLNKNEKGQGKGSKFIKSSSKPANVTKKVRSTGSRGS